jgi:autotransporter-associated beta strand protein
MGGASALGGTVTDVGQNSSTPTTLTFSGPGTLIFSGSNSYTGNTVISGGTLILGSSTALPSGNNVANDSGLVINAVVTAGNISDPGTSGSTTVNTGQSLAVNNLTQLGGLTNNGAVVINGSGKVGSIGGTGSLTLTSGSLQIAANNTGPFAGTPSSQGSLTLGSGATLDLTNNALIIDYGANAAFSDPVAAIQSYLANGFANGWATGGGNTAIISSTVAALKASQNALIYDVGYVDGADGITSVPSGELEIAPTLAGDAKMQGNVVFGDFQLLAQFFGQTGTAWDQGDFTYSGTTTFGDFQLLAQNFGSGTGGLTSGEIASLGTFANAFGHELVPHADGVGFSTVAVPEPASLGLIASAGLGLLSRRRRRK